MNQIDKAIENRIREMLNLCGKRYGFSGEEAYVELLLESKKRGRPKKEQKSVEIIKHVEEEEEEEVEEINVKRVQIKGKNYYKSMLTGELYDIESKEKVCVE